MARFIVNFLGHACSIKVYKSSQHTPESQHRIKSLYHPTIVSDPRRNRCPGNDNNSNIQEVGLTCPTRILLCQARQYVQLVENRHGRKPAIMDIILELLSPVQHNEGTLMDEIERNRRLNQLHYNYGHIFKGEGSLHTYWAQQAHTIVAMRHDASAPRTGFDISAVRSTAGWIATLEGDSGGDKSPSP